MKRTKTTSENLPSDEKMLNFVIEMMTWPFKCHMGAPDHETGSTGGRSEGSEYYFSFSSQSVLAGYLDGCVYAPTAREAIAKAMQLRAAQKKAAALITKAEGSGQ